MATWNELVSYLNSNYKIASKRGDSFLLKNFSVGDERHQDIIVSKFDCKEEWLTIRSAFGFNLTSGQFMEAAEFISKTVGGGIIREGRYALVAAKIKLKSLNLKDLGVYFSNVAVFADMLEKRFSGTDMF